MTALRCHRLAHFIFSNLAVPACRVMGAQDYFVSTTVHMLQPEGQPTSVQVGACRIGHVGAGLSLPLLWFTGATLGLLDAQSAISIIFKPFSARCSRSCSSRSASPCFLPGS